MKRTADNWPNNVVKKEKLEDFSVVMAQNDRNRQTASEDITRNCNLYQTGVLFVKICGKAVIIWSFVSMLCRFFLLSFLFKYPYSFISVLFHYRTIFFYRFFSVICSNLFRLSCISLSFIFHFFSNPIFSLANKNQKLKMPKFPNRDLLLFGS